MTALTTNVHDVALIFEGGGMRASYTSAVVARLIQEGIFFDWVGGISAGSSCTANYLSRDAERARSSFVDLAADPQFGNWRTWLQGKGRFNAKYIYEETGAPGQAFPYDWETFSANPAQMALGAFEARTGRMRYFGREDVTQLLDLMQFVRASSSLPILMPPVVRGEEIYVDGALGPTGGFALDAARAAGFEKFFVVMTRAREYRKPPARMPAFYRAAFRGTPEVTRAILERPARYNRTREELFALERQGRAYLFCPTDLTVSNSESDPRKLQRMFDLGRAQAERELPAWRAFLGLGD